MEERLSAANGEILAGIHAGVATVTLNRPSALNALSLGMLEALTRWLDAWEVDERVRLVVLRGAGDKAFCAGGDIRALHAGIKANDPGVHRFFEVEYALDYRIHTYAKTIAAVIDGIVMGGGMGISQGADVRIVGERTRMAMPETAIGLFPDVGGSYFLSRVPGELGTYLGLVGPTLRAADAIYCGLADIHAGSAPLAEPELEPLRPAIDQHFAGDSVEAIVESLGGEDRPQYRAWAAKSLEALARRSPTMLSVTLEQLRRGARLALGDCLRMELNLIHGCFEQGDILEGIRALLVDKDNQPRWRPPKLAGVVPAAVDAFFAPRWQPTQHPLAFLQ
ncbi:MAG TPA: enoyl-CoA hydratase/isomerase family protein [Usitatibacter sp.]|nr:enoyl-CoA hydratase/isomerase family protein [Usitatibacter sp.]